MYYKLNTRPFIKTCKEQNIDENTLIDILELCYDNIPFSTFPYIFHNFNSYETLKHCNSGNCISLSIFIKKQLQKLGIKSYLIPATIPLKYQRGNYLDISHVAVAVPGKDDIIYILDGAFYFKVPMKVYLNSSKQYKLKMTDIYNDKLDDIYYNTTLNKKREILNEYQSIPANTYAIETSFKDNQTDKWRYFIREIKNPDEAISNFFINIRKLEPFITKTRQINNKCHCELMVKLNNNHLEIRHYNKLIYKGDPQKIPPNILHHIQKLLSPYFIKQLKQYFNSNIIPSYDIKIK